MTITVQDPIYINPRVTVDGRNSSFLFPKPTGTATAQTAAIKAAFEQAMDDNLTVILSGNYSVNGQIAITKTGTLKIEVRGSANIDVVSGASAISYLIFLQSASHSVFIIGGPLTIDGNDLIKGGIRLQTTASTGTGKVALVNVEVSNVTNANTDDSFANSISGIDVLGKYVDVALFRCHAANVSNEGVNASNATAGLVVSGYTSDCLIDSCSATNITNEGLGFDGDGIKVFGSGDVGSTITYRAQTALVNNCKLIDCEGRGIKFQTSEARCTNCKFQQLTVPMIENGVCVAFQWGNGFVSDCKFEFASGMVGSSMTIVNFANVLTGTTYTKSVFQNSHIKSVDAIPRIVLINEDSGTYLGDGDSVVECRNITGERAAGRLVSRSFLEHVSIPRIIAKTGGTTIRIDNVELPLSESGSGSPLVGYVGYTTGTIGEKLFIDLRDCKSTGADSENAAKMFRQLSGNAITDYRFRFRGLENIDSVVYSLIDFDKLVAGAEFVMLASGSEVNGPSPALTNGVYYAVKVIAQQYPKTLNIVEVTRLGSTAQRYTKFGATWNTATTEV
jgi:hypothetical protein